jgi:hypothetical protein
MVRQSKANRKSQIDEYIACIKFGAMTAFMNKSVTLKSFIFLCLFTFGYLASAQSCQDAATITPSSTGKSFKGNTTMKNCYVPGASDTVSFAISPDAADLNAPRVVVVFDIVSNNDDGFPSKIMQVLDVNALSVTPDIFRDSLEMSVVQAGLEGEIAFKMRGNAPVGKYTMVISFFRLPEGLRPRDVTYDPNALAGRVFYNFRIEE